MEKNSQLAADSSDNAILHQCVDDQRAYLVLIAPPCLCGSVRRLVCNRKFTLPRTRKLVSRIEFGHTLKHGSWLNVAEHELGSLIRKKLLGRRLSDLETGRQNLRESRENLLPPGIAAVGFAMRDFWHADQRMDACS